MIRVLHVFAPAFGQTFSGDNKLWMRTFQKWMEERVSHHVASVEQGMTVDARTIKKTFGQKNLVNTITLSRGRRVLWAIKVLWFLVYQRRHYDIIHIHTDHWGALLAALLVRLLGRPSVVQIVRMGEDDPSTLLEQSLGRLKLWCFKQNRRILCVSDALRQECLRQGIEADQALLLINPVDANVFSPFADNLQQDLIRRKLKLPENGRIILSVGSLIARKGTDLLLEAFKSLVNSRPDLVLVLVGPSSRAESVSVDESFVASLRQDISRSGLTERVFITGRIDEDAVLADYYRAADFFALPTRQEGLPNVLLEAQSVGLPLVATCLPGSTDLVVQDGRTGYLIPAEDVNALKAKLQMLLDHPDRGREMGKAARENVLQKFGFETWRERLIGIYTSLV